MMGKISANGIDDVRNVKTMMIYECKGTNEHPLIGSKRAFLHSVHMRMLVWQSSHII